MLKRFRSSPEIAFVVYIIVLEEDIFSAKESKEMIEERSAKGYKKYCSSIDNRFVNF